MERAFFVHSVSPGWKRRGKKGIVKISFTWSNPYLIQERRRRRQERKLVWLSFWCILLFSISLFFSFISSFYFFPHILFDPNKMSRKTETNYTPFSILLSQYSLQQPSYYSLSKLPILFFNSLTLLDPFRTPSCHSPVLVIFSILCFPTLHFPA